MLNHTKQIKEIYEEIQRKLLYLIPEKWESIYLYSSVIDNGEKEPTGELFFYYIPKGIFRKNPVNVYEVPSKFNIDETQYLDLVEKLYDNIKLLREEFKRTTPGEMWSNLTISITNMKFRAEYSYEDLVNNAFNSYERHVIWRYKYLGIGPEQVSKKDKDILFRYFNGARNLAEVEEYNAGIYIEQDTKNIFEYSTQEDELENDGYIREDETPNIGIQKQYNQIKSHKIENNWDANVRKKEETMWSHDNKSAEQYIIKSSRGFRNNKKIDKQENVTLNEVKQNNVDEVKNEDTIEKMRKLQEELLAKKINDIQDEKTKQKMKKVTQPVNKKKKRNNKEEVTNEEIKKTIRNQILFSEDEIEAPIPEEGKWVKAKEIKDISGLTHGIGWCAPQQGACKLTLNVKDGIIQEALIETIGCSGMTHSAAMAGEILTGKTILEALNTDLVCDAINTAMRELFLQIVYGRTQTAFSEGGLPVGAGLEDLGKGHTSQVGTIYSSTLKGPRYLQLTEGYIVELGLDKDDQIIGYKYVHMGKMMDNIKKGMDPMEAIEKASGTYGRFDEAVKKIDPRQN